MIPLRFLLCALMVGGLAACPTGDFEARFAEAADRAAASHPVPVMTREALAAAYADGPASGTLPVDTRAPEEFAVSRLPGAIPWAPEDFGRVPESVRDAVARGDRIVFYCSIGERSGEAAERAAEALGAQAKLFNLYGGIFGWANAGGALEGGERVHGYDARWERLLRPDLRAPR